jgi:DNA-binding beta-propeller fold protein YncE
MSRFQLHGGVRSRLSAAAGLVLLSLISGAQSSSGVGPARFRSWDVDCRPSRVSPAIPFGHLALGSYLGCSADSALPWSVAFAPGGQFAYVSLFGGLIGNGGCLLAKVDVASHLVTSLIQVEESPEEMVFTSFPNGNMRFGWVGCSSASSVVVFNTGDQIVASIPIPADAGSGWPTAFPSGLVVSPDQKRVWVGTLDGSGRIFALDGRVPALLPAETIHLGPNRAVGRMQFANGELIIPATRMHAAGQGSTAELIFLDPRDPANRTVLPLATSADGSAFPSAQDLALACDGRVFVVGFDLGPSIYVVSAATRSLLRTLPTFTSHSQGKFQALGLSPQGLLAVADFYTNEVSLYDTWGERWLGLVDATAYTSVHTQLNELAFTPDGRELWFACHTSENLAFSSVP